MIQEWFKIPIYHNITNNFEKIQEEIQNCYRQIDFSKHEGWGESNHSLSSPNFGGNDVLQYNLTNFKKEIEYQVKEYTKQFSDTSYAVEILDSWITNTAPKEHTVVHNHGDADISGVYYFKATEQSGKIYFLNPNTSLMISHYLKPNDYVEYPPLEGLFILFPAWLYHGVRSNDTDKNRISVSFNIRLHKL